MLNKAVVKLGLWLPVFESSLNTTMFIIVSFFSLCHLSNHRQQKKGRVKHLSVWVIKSFLTLSKVKEVRQHNATCTGRRTHL